MNGEEKYVLAMYDIRGKQQYIYRSNHLKEIVGGSAIIRDCFKDYLYPAAKEYRNRGNKEDDAVTNSEAIFHYTEGLDPEKNEEQISQEAFKREEFEKRMEGSQYLGEVVYSGGGNFFVLYKDKTTCVEINKIFTRKLLEETYSLKVLCTYIEDVNFDNYPEDRRRLYEAHRYHEARESVVLPAEVLPFTQVDYQTSMPLYKMVKTSGEKARKDKVTKENYRKYQKYWEVEKKQKSEFGERLLDNLVSEKGVESLLAIVYIDGNNMGAKVEACLTEEDTSYDTCVNKLRKFSREIQTNYIDNAMQAIDRALEEKYPREDEQGKKRRFVIYAGDEINFICNARDAYNAVKAYFSALPEGCSACAGIAIFHSHAPYAEAYRIAEACCESGKQKMKAENLTDANLMDVHYCQAGIGVDLETIRQKEVGDMISKPWFITISEREKKPEYVTIEMIEKMVGELKKTGRSNIKSLLEYAKDSLQSLKMDLERIKAHSNNPMDFTLGKTITEEQMRRMIYDIVTVYDLWFA